MLDLIEIKFSEILRIHFAFFRVGYGNKTVELNRHVLFHPADGADDVGKLADAGRLDENTIRRKTGYHIAQCLTEISHECAADAAGAHFCDLHSGIPEKAAVDIDLTEFIFDEDDLFAFKGFRDQLSDERSLSGSEEAGKNVDFCHMNNLL